MPTIQLPLSSPLTITIQITPEGLMSVSGPLRSSSPSILRLFDPTDNDTRTTGPGVTPPTERRWVLRSVFHLLLWRPKRAEKAVATWYDYRTLLSRWEAYHAQRGLPRGPDVREISDSMLREFFESQVEWGTQRTWTKYRDLMAAILKTCLRRSERNRSGPRQDEALLEELPWLEIPPQRWFSARQSPSARKGGHSPSRDSLLSIDEFERVLVACRMATFPKHDACDPLAFWTAFFAMSWTYGPRLQDLLGLTWDAVDWTRSTLRFTESKKGNEVSVPIAPAVLKALQSIRRGDRAEILPLPPGHRKNATRRFYPQYRLIWQWAGVPLRLPHQLRATSISHWKEHAPEWSTFATGHSRAGNVQDQYYVIAGEAFRNAVNTFPQPPSLLDGIT